MLGILRRWLAKRTTRPPTAVAVSAGRLAEDLQAKIQELEAGQSQMEGILQGMAEGVLAVGPSGEILLVNRAAREILEIKQDPPAGTRASGLIRQPQLQELIHQALTKQEPQVRDLTLVAPAERHLRIHITSCRMPGGRGALAVLHDITDLKRLENLRRDFVANVSHELKTPLTAIRGAVETLLGGASKDPAHSRSFLEAIAEESARLDRLVEDLLTLAQVESKQAVLRREPVSIDRFLEEEVGRHQALARTHQVSLQLESPPSAQSLFADQSQMSQAVSNLLDNAIKYNRAGGRVMVRALAREGQCRIEVEDTGIGIPAGDLPRIFERFYRVDKARSRETGGTGLGLSIVKHVAEAHGGSVQVESRLGKGSRFILSIPLR